MQYSAAVGAGLVGAALLYRLARAKKPKKDKKDKNKKDKSSSSEEKKELRDDVENGFSRERISRLDEWLEKYVDSGKLACAAAYVTRKGETTYLGYKGHMDLEQKRPAQLDTIYRVYSMTKCVTAVAAMMLWEEGKFHLNDPIHTLLPQFKNMQVYVSGPIDNPVTVPANKPIQFRHLFCHTSGFTYHFLNTSVVDELYRKHDIDFLSPRRTSLKDLVDKLATLPLVAHPGERWNYSVAMDVMAYIVELLSGMPFAEFCKQRIFGPLGMVDTFFTVPAAKAHRFASCYVPFKRNNEPTTLLLDPPSPTVLNFPCGKGNYCADPECLNTHPDQRAKPETLRQKIAAGTFPASPFYDELGTTVPSGGGGLCSTLSDWMVFARMLAHGGELNDTRLLAPRTIELMSANSLPNNQDLEQCGNRIFSEMSFDGIGFGLGFGVLMDPCKVGSVGTAGTFSWGGLASTYFFVDPIEEISAVFMTQLVPSSTYGDIRRNFTTLIYTSLVKSGKKKHK